MLNKKKKLFFVFSFLFIILFSDLWLYKIFFIEDKVFTDQIHRHIDSLVASRSDRIKDYLKERKSDVIISANSEYIKDMLRQDLFSNIDAARKNINKKAKISVREVETYLKANDQMSFYDLQKSEEFKELVIVPFGRSGMVSVFPDDSGSSKNNYRRFENFGLDLIDKQNNDLVEIANRAKIGGSSEGIYQWQSIGGVSCQKYVRFQQVSKRTSDGASLIIQASNCIDEYKTVLNISEKSRKYIDQFNQRSDYYNLILISSAGRFVYASGETDDYGMDLHWLENGLAQSYFLIEKKDKAVIFGPYLGEYDDVMRMAFGSPVYEEGKLLGYVILIDTMDEIIQIATELTGLGETGDSYLVDQDGSLITPTRFKQSDLLAQSIKTKNMNDCLDGLRISKGEIRTYNNDIYKFLNYAGEWTYGSHIEILEPGWCVLTEISVKEVFVTPKRGRIKSEVITLLSSVATLLILAGLSGKYWK